MYMEYKGQAVLSVRQVCTKKAINNKILLKARLVTRGFEVTEDIRADSPTGSQETPGIYMSIYRDVYHYACEISFSLDKRM